MLHIFYLFLFKLDKTISNESEIGKVNNTKQSGLFLRYRQST